MIPDEAVEAAARAYFENEDWRPSWDYVEEPNRSEIRADLRAALEAAAPHMTQPAPDEALQKILITLDAVTAGQLPQDVAFTVVHEISEHWRKEHGTP